MIVTDNHCRAPADVKELFRNVPHRHGHVRPPKSGEYLGVDGQVATHVVPGDKVTAVPFPESSGAVNTYPIAVLKESKNPAATQKFVELVTGPEGQKVLAAAGFAAP